MWLLELHFSISILCLLTFVGLKYTMIDTIKKNGYLTKDNKKKNIFNNLIFIVPIMNILTIVLVFIMMLVTKEEFDTWCEELKTKK